MDILGNALIGDLAEIEYNGYKVWGRLIDIDYKSDKPFCVLYLGNKNWYEKIKIIRSK